MAHHRQVLPAAVIPEDVDSSRWVPGGGVHRELGRRRSLRVNGELSCGKNVLAAPPKLSLTASRATSGGGLTFPSLSFWI